MIAYLTANGLSPQDRALLKRLLRQERVVFELLNGLDTAPLPTIDEHPPIIRILQQILDCQYPGPDELESAPILHQWGLGLRDFTREPCLIGICNGPPSVRGPRVRTSRAFVIATELGWARTLSRFYRLGRPYTEGSA